MAQSELKNITALYVEDEANIRRTLANAIRDEFKLFFTAADGNEGLKKFKKYKPDIVITDLLMPVKDGLSLARDIKAMSKDTLVVVLSAFSEKEKLLGAIDVGVDKYIIKPIYPDELLSLITKLAQQRFTVGNITELGDGYQFDKNKKALIKDGAVITLTKKEIAFISFLVDSVDHFALHEDIKRCIWSKNTSDAAVRTFVKRIRNKTNKYFIKNIPTLGYKIL
ncbi:MAG: response regulator transcription factor [Campylobacteraceae bacterium]|jgi:DNA-binding response OmpR family regulator|nr:response regulator transcription factor [Campylobacteraceae bacterium]